MYRDCTANFASAPAAYRDLKLFDSHTCSLFESRPKFKILARKRLVHTLQPGREDQDKE